MAETEVTARPPSILTRFAKALADAELEVARIEEQLKKAKAYAAVREKKLVEEMITQEVKSFKTEFSGGFRTQAVVYPNVTDREALEVYIKKKKLQWLLTKALHGGKLRAFITELMEQGKPIPPGIEPYTTTEIRRYK
jgi:hypothetical protein